jgi:cholesterol transport system auxiliary component
MKHKYLLLLLSTALLSGCLSPVKSEPPAAYMLNVLPHNLPARHSSQSVLLIQPPEIRPIYNTTQMAYVMKPFQIQYFSEHQWAETPSQMLLPLILQTLINTNHYRAVVTPPYMSAYQYVLNTQILRFEQDFIKTPHSFQLVVHANITRLATNQLVASKEFAVSVPLSQESPYSGVIAANIATRQFLQELAQFALDKT